MSAATARPTSPTAGALLRRHRLLAGLTQEAFAARTGLGLRTLRDLERGRVRRPHDRSITLLATVLQLSAGELRELRTAFATPDTDRRLRVAVLGPLLVTRGGGRVDVGPPLRRRLLGLLALRASGCVPRDELVDVLWGDRPPRTCHRLIHMHVTRLRSVLDPQRVRRSPRQSIVLAADGYRLDLAQVEVDLARFDQLSARAQQAHRDGLLRDARAGYEEALECWRGPVLADADARLRHHPSAVAAGRRRISATLRYADVAEALGQPELAVTPLQALAPVEPLHEGLHARLVVALAGAGEPATALALFAEYRQRVRDQLGAEPGPELGRAHLRVLRGAVGADRPTGAPLWTRPSLAP